MRGAVERQFVRDVHLGETVLPFRLLTPPAGSTAGHRRRNPDCPKDRGAGRDRRLVAGRRGDLGAVQVEVRPERLARQDQLSWPVVRPAAGSRAPRRLHGVGQHARRSARRRPPRRDRAQALLGGGQRRGRSPISLTAILNSDLLLERVRPLQALGLFGGRDSDKNVFSVLIPTYSRGDSDHQAVPDLAAEAEQLGRVSVVIAASPRSRRARRRLGTRGRVCRSGWPGRTSSSCG
jgi:hypothetical protein